MVPQRNTGNRLQQCRKRIRQHDPGGLIAEYNITSTLTKSQYAIAMQLKKKRNTVSSQKKQKCVINLT